MWNRSVALVDVFVSQWSGKQEQWSSKAHDDREHKVRFSVSMVAEPLEVLVEGDMDFTAIQVLDFSGLWIAD